MGVGLSASTTSSTAAAATTACATTTTTTSAAATTGRHERTTGCTTTGACCAFCFDLDTAHDFIIRIQATEHLNLCVIIETGSDLFFDKAVARLYPDKARCSRSRRRIDLS